MHLDGEPDITGVQTGRQIQQPGCRRPAQAVGLAASAVLEPLEEIVGIADDVDLALVHAHHVVEDSRHERQCASPLLRLPGRNLVDELQSVFVIPLLAYLQKPVLPDKLQ